MTSTFKVSVTSVVKKAKDLFDVIEKRRDSRSKGRWFESRHLILDGHFFTYICCKNCLVCLKRPKINEKEARVGPFKHLLLKDLTFLNVAVTVQ